MTFETFARRYHVPRSQVWAGSRGAQTGRVHLHVREPFDHGRIHRAPHDSLCGRRGWYERPPEGLLERSDVELCPSCVKIATKAGASA